MSPDSGAPFGWHTNQRRLSAPHPDEVARWGEPLAWQGPDGVRKAAEQYLANAAFKKRLSQSAKLAELVEGNEDQRLAYLAIVHALARQWQVEESTRRRTNPELAGLWRKLAEAATSLREAGDDAGLTSQIEGRMQELADTIAARKGRPEGLQNARARALERDLSALHRMRFVPLFKKKDRLELIHTVLSEVRDKRNEPELTRAAIGDALKRKLRKGTKVTR